jgi:DNA-binding CsgD family transcriptional regulator
MERIVFGRTAKNTVSAFIRDQDLMRADVGRLLVVHGGAGTGKSALLREVAAEARVTGLAPLFLVQGDKAVEQAPILWQMVADIRRRELFGGDGGLVVVDDAHRVDAAVLEALLRCGRTGLAVSLVDTSGEDCASSRVQLLERAVWLPLGDLDAVGSQALLQEGIGRPPAEEFVIYCHKATGGNPALLAQLSRAVVLGYVTEDVTSMRQAILRHRDFIALPLVARLQALPVPCASVGRVLAALPDADPSLLAELLAVDPDQAAEALRILAVHGVVAAMPRTGLRHPVVRIALSASATDLYRWHHVAADHLRRRGMPEAVVVRHLVAGRGPCGEDWVRPVLRNAARRALSAGAHDLAAACLRRLLTEPLSDVVRAELEEQLRHADARVRRDELTPHQRRIADLAVSGMTNREIARVLNISTRAVEFQLTGVFRKLGIMRRVQLPHALEARRTAAEAVSGPLVHQK